MVLRQVEHQVAEGLAGAARGREMKSSQARGVSEFSSAAERVRSAL